MTGFFRAPPYGDVGVRVSASVGGNVGVIARSGGRGNGTEYEARAPPRYSCCETEFGVTLLCPQRTGAFSYSRHSAKSVH